MATQLGNGRRARMCNRRRSSGRSARNAQHRPQVRARARARYNLNENRFFISISPLAHLNTCTRALAGGRNQAAREKPRPRAWAATAEDGYAGLDARARESAFSSPNLDYARARARRILASAAAAAAQE